MARFSHHRGSTVLTITNLTGAVGVAFMLAVNLMRGYPLLALAGRTGPLGPSTEIDVATNPNPREHRARKADSEGRRDAERRLNDVANAVRDQEEPTQQELAPASSADRRLRQALRR